MIKLISKYFGFFFLLSVLVIIVGCSEKSLVENNNNNNDMINDNTQDTKTLTTVESDDGSVKITSNIDGTEGWCEPGLVWMSESMEEGQNQNVEMTVVGLVSEGKYKELCHIKYKVKTASEDMLFDAYVNEERHGYQVMTINGETTEIEI